MSNEIRKEELFGYLHEYDENDNEIHHKGSDGYEYWKEYDEYERLIHFKDSKEFEEWY